MDIVKLSPPAMRGALKAATAPGFVRHYGALDDKWLEVLKGRFTFLAAFVKPKRGADGWPDLTTPYGAKEFLRRTFGYQVVGLVPIMVGNALALWEFEIEPICVPLTGELMPMGDGMACTFYDYPNIGVTELYSWVKVKGLPLSMLDSAEDFLAPQAGEGEDAPTAITPMRKIRQVVVPEKKKCRHGTIYVLGMLDVKTLVDEGILQRYNFISWLKRPNWTFDFDCDGLPLNFSNADTDICVVCNNPHFVTGEEHDPCPQMMFLESVGRHQALDRFFKGPGKKKAVETAVIAKARAATPVSSESSDSEIEEVEVVKEVPAPEKASKKRARDEKEEGKEAPQAKKAAVRASTPPVAGPSKEPATTPTPGPKKPKNASKPKRGTGRK